MKGITYPVQTYEVIKFLDENDRFGNTRRKNTNSGENGRLDGSLRLVVLERSGHD